MDDLISRKAAVNILANGLDKIPMVNNTADEMIRRDERIICLQEIRSLPSAQPETAKRIVGKSRDGMTLWYQCDMCNEPVDAQDNYCRGCGRRLIDG